MENQFPLQKIFFCEKEKLIFKLQSKKIINFFRWKRIYLNKDSLKNLAIKSKKSLTRFKKLVNSVNKKQKN